MFHIVVISPFIMALYQTRQNSFKNTFCRAMINKLILQVIFMSCEFDLHWVSEYSGTAVHDFHEFLWQLLKVQAQVKARSLNTD